MDSYQTSPVLVADSSIQSTPIHPMMGVPIRHQMRPPISSGPPRIPASQHRLLRRQHAQMARQREAHQRWMADQHRQRAMHQRQSQPLVNGLNDVAAAQRTAAAAAAAAAVATASNFLYPTFYGNMAPSQQLILESSPTVIAQTTISGTPFQLVQPQDVAMERLFAPIAAAAATQATLTTVMSSGVGGTAVAFRSMPTMNATTIMPFIPYFWVDNSQFRHYYHHSPNPGMVASRQLAELTDLPQGATRQSIEKHTYVREYRRPKESVPIGEEEKCSICISEFEQDQQLRVLKCKHTFHVECIDRWLSQNKKCPICRLDIDQHQ